MVIDFHTHIFPDRIAKKTIEMLSARGQIPAYSDGDVKTTLMSMDDAGIDISVVQGIATNPKQNENVNNFAIELNSYDRFVAFGSVHPEADWQYELDRLKDSGIVGIKLHPDYQDFFIDDKKMQPIYEYILKKDFVLLFHAGFDIGLGEPIHADSKRIKNTLGLFSGEKVVFAHMGSMADFEGNKNCLWGKDVYIDTSVFPFYMTKEQYREALFLHGEDKILFATDLPWTSQKESLNKLSQVLPDGEMREKILYKNASYLLSI